MLTTGSYEKNQKLIVDTKYKLNLDFLSTSFQKGKYLTNFEKLTENFTSYR
jgi:hypothetical protein